MLHIYYTLNHFWPVLLPPVLFHLISCHPVHLSTEDVLDREVGGLGLVVKVLESSCSLSGKDTWDPTGLVAESPHGDTGAEVIVETDLNDIRIVLGPT
jgi:hypothetical protein